MNMRACGALCLVLCLLMGSCGYQWQGSDNLTVDSVIGDGSSTLKFGNVEQTSMYPWVPYYLRSIIRDEVNLRKLARWVDSGHADYTMSVRMPAFLMRSRVSDAEDVTLLNVAQVQLEIEISNGTTGEVVWRSGIISYSENYENTRESVAIREVLTQAVNRGLDRMQQKEF